MPAPIQSRTAATGTSLAFSANVLAGSLLVIAIATPTASGNPNPTGGGQWLVSGARLGNSPQTGHSSAVYYCLSATGGATTVTWTGTASEVIIAEFASVIGIADGNNGQQLSGANAANSGSITPSGVGDLVVGTVGAFETARAYPSNWGVVASVANAETLELLWRDAVARNVALSLTTANSLTSPNSIIQAFAYGPRTNSVGAGAAPPYYRSRNKHGRTGGDDL